MRASPNHRRLALALSTVATLSFGVPAQGSASVPEVKSFSQALRSSERVGAPSHDAVYRTEVMSAPRRFDLAGLGGELREAELRARPEDGEWTDWAETANGDPVWFGGMDQLQIRTHGWVPRGTIGYVRVTETGSATAAARGSDSGRPEIVSRSEWGANKDGTGCKPRKEPDYAVVKAASVHHTVSAVQYDEADAPGMVLGICRFHRNDNGWNDIGYNALVDRFGNIYEGRAGGLRRAVQGAHAEGVNSQTSGVAVIGTHTSEPASRNAIGALARWLSWKLPQHGLDTTGKATLNSKGGATALYPKGESFETRRIIGHRVTNQTECPGNALNAQIPGLRRKVQKRIDR